MNGVSRLNPSPPLDLLKSRLIYNPDTGNFTWRADGRQAGGAEGRGYWRIGLAGQDYKAHRLAWFYVTGEWPDVDIDHINGNRTDNRFGNLRRATRAENIQAGRGHKDKIGSLPKGVSFDTPRGKYAARIYVDGKHKYLGRFADPIAASRAYHAAARRYFGHFAPQPSS